ncbi:hypothetical protein BEWA_025980 [Theileria equi strain WA]|uniref:Uncharacterized protein n=1 Tax=Theileria equi strain WA TaxID=1537102 RepID=L0AXV7_THEEQ|nr:hypothetical protein BEWA_025980 [Theileria equi strain WA]AFZ79749.1 hypothetical protein BEWA_025980 [Theileria equi strain WA]|eukprot:XP_004829415.1 hypothetical protein BEWA_025980 [Theileria equi strain WA]
MIMHYCGVGLHVFVIITQRSYNKQFHKVPANREELLKHELELPENKFAFT